MKRMAEVKRKTKETEINIKLDINGTGNHEITSGIPFFDHMLSLFAVHGFFDVSIFAKGDIEVDFHHTVEDVGLVLGDAFHKALGDRKGIKRYGHAVVPMDDALTSVTVDLSNRPFLVYNIPGITRSSGGSFDIHIAKEFFRAFATRSGMNLHINVFYGENDHHVVESIFKAFGRALDQATSFDERITNVRSTKGSL
ncbi:MAG: imidazoleglycerol-phosphate dehydratase HisB [Desulfobacterales bacterium]|uniref:Imidazoleglycerol-phosphate dehydratase n=1 Tax=Candidatus Desulfaltia bathyphila TaxID=2841697 RepID=A0A8J6N8Y3_9BACT|nr:imidazoleglycerol-phosphate dehydratase HisB [Candidatus Desulfaltia bathyphila]MBL7195249.1 imidazoleglycerol-phosphate dehydratase HisB [Desulfobacterales bacterium]MBL7208092.1 imidazoleglycerol-phosphate dehydratase HisB [Desulfobacterales bacterium]